MDTLAEGRFAIVRRAQLNSGKDRSVVAAKALKSRLSVVYESANRTFFTLESAWNFVTNAHFGTVTKAQTLVLWKRPEISTAKQYKYSHIDAAFTWRLFVYTKCGIVGFTASSMDTVDTHDQLNNTEIG